MPDWIGDQMAGVGPEATRGLRPECANSGHPPMAWRTGQIDPSLPFPMSRYGRNFSESGRRRYGQMRKAASIRDQATD
jgi:hypothetical protein